MRVQQQTRAFDRVSRHRDEARGLPLQLAFLVGICPVGEFLANVGQGQVGAIEVVVRYEHRSIEHKFAPSATVFKVLEWAIGKKGYGLDPLSAAKANLILPGADQPMPRDRTIGSFTKRGEKRLVVDLTLKDFTNG